MKNFGKLAKDVVTGFEGVITARIEYIYGCIQYCLTPKTDGDGKLQKNEWFDVGRIILLPGSPVINPEEVRNFDAGISGGEGMEHPPEREHPEL